MVGRKRADKKKGLQGGKRGKTLFDGKTKVRVKADLTRFM